MIIHFFILLQIFFLYKEVQGHMTENCVMSTNFEDIVSSPCFVDKTLLIKEFIKMDSVNLITTPKGFGKTVNLNMLKFFLAHKIGEENYKNFDGSTRCKFFTDKHLYISEEEQFFDEHCGKYPVIYMNFELIKGSNFPIILKSFKKVLHFTFRDHSYLLKNNSNNMIWSMERTEIFDERCFLKYWDDTQYEKLSLESTLDGIETLSQILRYTFKEECIILIDNFDKPISNLLFGTPSDKDIEETVDFLKKIVLINIKENQHIKKGMINGELGFSGVKSLLTKGILHFVFLENIELTQFYGVLSSEIKQILFKRSHSDEKTKIKEWYAGYKVVHSEWEIYNFRSVVSYMNSEVFQSFWPGIPGLKANNLKQIISQDDVKKKVRKLLKEEEIHFKKIKIQDSFDMMNLKNILNGKVHKLVNEEVNIFFQFLYDHGFFVSKSLVNTKEKLTVAIPNMEMMEILRKQLNNDSSYEND